MKSLPSKLLGTVGRELDELLTLDVMEPLLDRAWTLSSESLVLVSVMIPAVDHGRSVPKKAQLLLMGFCPAFRLGGERGEADGSRVPHRLAPCRGLAGSQLASRCRGASPLVHPGQQDPHREGGFLQRRLEQVPGRQRRRW